MFVTFLSDFGLQDDFVGTCHGVIKRIAPEAQIIDITHGIPPQQVLQGALVLASTLPYMPVGVHLAVIDPGRRQLAARRSRCATGRAGYFVGPDNGLLVPAADLAGIEPRTSSRTRSTPSTRSRARSTGATSSRLRPLILRAASPSTSSARRLLPTRSSASTFPQPEIGGNRIAGTVLYVDSFGNVALNVTREHVAEVGIVPGTQVELELGGERFYAVAARTFADARAGDIMLYEDSYRNMSVAISNGNAAEMLHARAGQSIRINVGRL